jgi:hypothetical protein
VHVESDHPDAIIADLQVLHKEVPGVAGSTKWMAAIIKAATLAGPMFQRVVAATAADNLLYVICVS